MKLKSLTHSFDNEAEVNMIDIYPEKMILFAQTCAHSLMLKSVDAGSTYDPMTDLVSIIQK